ncbi:hypothetical protein ACOSQ3_010216 [Xanthoceras sorbifolium]
MVALNFPSWTTKALPSGYVLMLSEPSITFLLLSLRTTSETVSRRIGNGLIAIIHPLTSSRVRFSPSRNLKIRFFSMFFLCVASSLGLVKTSFSNMSTCCYNLESFVYY